MITRPLEEIFSYKLEKLSIVYMVQEFQIILGFCPQYGLVKPSRSSNDYPIMCVGAGSLQFHT